MSKWQIKNIALISRNNPRYVMYCREQIAIKNAIPKERVADSQQLVTSWAESSINQLLGKYFEKDDRSILTWEELGSSASYRRKYKELDGLFRSSNSLIYVETKASTSNSSFKKGKSQINENLQILSNINTRFSALLVLLDCNVLDPSFGVMSEELRKQIHLTEEYSVFEGLAEIPQVAPGKKSIWIIDGEGVSELVNIFGPPIEDTLDIDI